MRNYLFMHDSRLSIQAMHNFGMKAEVGGRSDAVQT